MLLKSPSYRSDLALQCHAGVDILINELDLSWHGCESRLAVSSRALAMLAGETHMFLLCPHIINFYVVSSYDHE